MPQQFVVPQFLDVESKIIGPITGRQFIILLAVLLLDFVFYRVFLNIFAVILIDVPITAIGVVFAFARVNGQPFHFIALNILQTFRKPRLRVWDKSFSDQMLKEQMKKDELQPVVENMPSKKPIDSSRLTELSLIVNTGGVYNPEE
ncbi:PrgI family protein [Patescibacteria group bacterium]|nr:PrgI family protein [Patescibacteria group bacterium]